MGDVAPLRFHQTLLPLLIAPLGAMVVYALSAATFSNVSEYFPVQILLFGVGALVAGCIFVLPIMAVVSKFRRPPAWLAALWGLLVAWCAVAVIGLTSPIPNLTALRRVEVAVPCGFAGAAAGLVYALLAHRSASGE